VGVESDDGRRMGVAVCNTTLVVEVEGAVVAASQPNTFGRQISSTKRESVDLRIRMESVPVLYPAWKPMELKRQSLFEMNRIPRSFFTQQGAIGQE
jgi:hypothetical protein